MTSTIESLFARAIELPTEQRRAFIASACKDDPEALQRLGELVTMHERANAAAFMQFRKPPLDYHEGTQIGPYTLKSIIGKGGFGTVWVAQQRSPIERKVALKLIKPGMSSDEVLTRFEAERQTLAIMDHPNIAQIFDAGTTPSGEPYFVMEYVAGLPITEYCDEYRLSIRERLDVFLQVCRAVQHAHAKGIIHRDLKPSNVLVTSHDGKPLAKVIDFGVAKALHQPHADAYTRLGQLIGTPAYMSPEQISAAPDIDTRSDIYSLGAMLYELLAGRPPFDPKTFAQAAIDKIMEIVRTIDPPKPSTRVAETPETLRTVAHACKADPVRLKVLLKRDLDWIVMKALDKDRSRRYGTAESLVEDVERHLVGEAIKARPPSTSYRLSRFIRRNRALVGSLAAVFVAISVGAVTTTAQWHRAEHERGLAVANEIRAESEARAANVARQEIADLALKMVTEFQAKIVKLPGTGPIRGDMSETAMKSIEGLLAQVPDDSTLRLNLAKAITELGRTFADIRSPSQGDVSQAMRLQQRALAIYREELAKEPASDARSLDVATSLIRVADLLTTRGSYKEALEPYEEAIALLKELTRQSSPIAGSRIRLAAALASAGECHETLGDLEHAASLMEHAHEVRKAVLVESPEPRAQRNLAGGLLDLARLRTVLGDPRRGLELAEQAVAIRRQLARDENEQAEPRRDLARALIDTSRYSLIAGNLDSARSTAIEADRILTDLLKDERLGSVSGVDAADPRTRHAWITAQLRIADGSDPLQNAPALRERLNDALQEARRLVATAPDVVDYRQSLLEAMLVSGEHLSVAGDHTGAIRLLSEANEEAMRTLALMGGSNWTKLLHARNLKALGDAEARLALEPRMPDEERSAARTRARQWYERSLEAYKGLPECSDRANNIEALGGVIEQIRSH